MGAPWLSVALSCVPHHHIITNWATTAIPPPELARNSNPNPATPCPSHQHQQVNILFTHYAATDLHSTPDAFTKADSCNLKEYIHCLEELGFVKDPEDIMKDLRNQDSIEKGSGSEHIARRHKEVRAMRRWRHSQECRCFASLQPV